MLRAICSRQVIRALGARLLPGITVELSSIRYRTGLKEAKEDVLFNLRRSGRAGLELL